MFHPAVIRGNGLLVWVTGHHPGKVLFDAFTKPGVGVVENIPYKINTSAAYREYLPVAFY